MACGPAWTQWTSVDDKGGKIGGTMELHCLYDPSAEEYMLDAATAVSIANYADGSTGVMDQLPLTMEIGGSPVLYKTRAFAGTFKQSMDLACYPFDRQEMKWTLRIAAPHSLYMQLSLLCPPGYTPLDKDGKAVGTTEGPASASNFAVRGLVRSCQKDLDLTATGFEWEQLTCSLEGESIECAMHGARVYKRIFQNFMLPSVTVAIMSFSSFKMHHTLAMPRVATTMIAFLTQINLKNALSADLPSSGTISWLEFYFTVTMVLMLVNSLGHVVSFYMERNDHHQAALFIDEMLMYVIFCLWLMIPLLNLLSLDCDTDQVDGGMIVVLIIFCVLLIIVRKAFVLHRHKEDLERWNMHCGTWCARRRISEKMPLTEEDPEAKVQKASE